MIICKLVCMQEMKWNEMKGLLQFFQFVHPLELKIWSLLLMLHIEFFTCCCIGASLRHCLHFCSLAYELTITSWYVQTRFKSWKLLLFWAVSVIFSSFDEHQNAYEFIYSLIRVFGREFLRNYSVYWVNVFRDNWNCYDLSKFSDFISKAWSGNETHMSIRQKI